MNTVACLGHLLLYIIQYDQQQCFTLRCRDSENPPLPWISCRKKFMKITKIKAQCSQELLDEDFYVVEI
jgi:hypothetical protein